MDDVVQRRALGPLLLAATVADMCEAIGIKVSKADASRFRRILLVCFDAAGLDDPDRPIKNLLAHLKGS